MSSRIGIDIGGTFTDLIYYDDASGKLSVAKVPTTPTSPEQGCVDAVAAAINPEQLNSAEYFLHGTTVGLNALLERRGAVVGLLNTEGFRDTLEIRRGDRVEMYNLFWTPPPALVPRRLRQSIGGRIRADGEVHVPFSADDVRRATKVFEEEGVTSVAIAFINAYANPAHELEAEKELRSAGFAGEISLSHQVSGEYREYERTTTTVIDAFVKGRMSNYLRRLGEMLQEQGFDGSLLITRSGSGAMTFEEAEQRPFETIMSGPVAGAEGAGELSRRLDLGDLVTADVGGTSFDTCLITDGRPQLMYQGEVVGLPVQTQWVDVRSIGSGGGSIAHVDVGGLLRVGPESAGADPGPACYGRGGSEPAMTDAAFALGMLGEGKLASGLQLDRDRSVAALQPVADKLGFSVEDTARGVMKISAASMANAIREGTIEQGIDPRELKLLAFGGAGPLMCTLLARELDIKDIVVPPYAGNFSAWGLLGADLIRARARTRIMPLDDEALDTTNQMLGEMFDDLSDKDSEDGQVREVALDMRFVGQEHSLSIIVPSTNGELTVSLEEVESAFTASYLKTFGIEMDDAIEIVSVRATLRMPLPRRSDATPEANGSTDEAKAETQRIEAYSFEAGKVLDFALVDRLALKAGDTLSGPAIISEDTTTTYLDTGFDAKFDASGCIFIGYVGIDK